MAITKANKKQVERSSLRMSGFAPNRNLSKIVYQVSHNHQKNSRHGMYPVYELRFLMLETFDT